jgi:hypothetical protein
MPDPKMKIKKLFIPFYRHVSVVYLITPFSFHSGLYINKQPPITESAHSALLFPHLYSLEKALLNSKSSSLPGIGITSDGSPGDKAGNIKDSRSFPYGNYFLKDSRSFPYGNYSPKDTKSFPYENYSLRDSMSFPYGNYSLKDTKSFPYENNSLKDTKSFPYGDYSPPKFNPIFKRKVQSMLVVIFIFIFFIFYFIFFLFFHFFLKMYVSQH